MNLSYGKKQIFLYVVSIFLVAFTILEIANRLNSSWVTRESRIDVGYTHEIFGENTASWSFNPRSPTLKTLWVYYHPIDTANRVARVIDAKVYSEEANKLITQSETKIPPTDFKNGRAKLVFPDVNIPNSGRIRMVISLSENDQKEGVYLHYLPYRKFSSQVAHGNTTQEAAILDMVWLGKIRPIPVLLISIGTILLVLIPLVSNRELNTASRLSLVGIATSIILLVAGYGQDLRVNANPGYYWPDAYPLMGLDWFRLFSSEIDWSYFKEEFVNWRNGQVFLFPVLMALIQLSGVGQAASYQILVCFLTFSTVILFQWACCSIGFRNRWEQFIVLLVLVTNPFLIQAAGSFQTDIGGLFFTLLTLILVCKIIESSDEREFRAIAIAVLLSLIAGSLTRLSFISLIPLPLCVAGWLYVTQKAQSRIILFLLASTSFLSALILAIIWSQLELFPSIEKARGFSALPVFRDRFSWVGFFKITVLACWPILLVTFADSRRILSNPKLATIGGGICALLLVLAIGKIPPWQRYWTPIHISTLLFVLFYIAEQPKRAVHIKIFAVLAIAMNFFVFYLRGTLL